MRNAENSPSRTIEYVLDSYALLAYLGGEPGSIRVKVLLETAGRSDCRLYMCVVNLGEVMYIVEREKGLQKAQETLARINELPVNIEEVDNTLALAAAHLKAGCPIAYADCYAAALSKLKNAMLVTGDPEFRKLKPDVNVQIEWLEK